MPRAAAAASRDDLSVGGQSTMSAKEVRATVRDYIRNERDTVLIRWRTLGESVKSEDRTRDQFFYRRSREDSKSMPVNIQKFIGTLKRAVRKIMREKGGTPFSIIRALFMYWTSSTDGTLTTKDLKNVMNSLGVKMTDAERAEVVSYYSVHHTGAASANIITNADVGSGQEAQMSYLELLQDITRGEPTNIQAVPANYFDSDDVELRYEEEADQYAVKPPVIQEFIEATRNYIMLAMRTEGGTPYYHVRYLFQFFDYDLSNGLSPIELQTAARKKMKLAMTTPQAEQIVRYYDRKKEGQMQYDIFLKDVTEGELSRPMLSFKELTAQEREESQSKLATNVFMPRPFKANANRVLEEFKLSLKAALTKKIAGRAGGRFESWILGAFREYDKSLTNRVGSWETIRNIAHKLGVTIGKSTALTIICSYDKNHSGEMHYLDFIKDMDAEDPHFLEHSGQQVKAADVVGMARSVSMASSSAAAAASASSSSSSSSSSSGGAAAAPSNDSATTRCPEHIAKIIARFNKAAQIYALKSRSAMPPRDLLLGTFLRFDTQRLGHLSGEQVQQAADELRVPLGPDDVRLLVYWFDSKGTGRLLDYKSLCRQVFGSDDVITRGLTLPKLGKKAGSALYKATVTYEMDPNLGGSLDDDAGSVASVGVNGNFSVITRGASSGAAEGPGTSASASEVIESRKAKLARLVAKRAVALREREDVVQKLNAIDVAKKRLLSDLATRRAEEAAAKHKEESLQVLQNMAVAKQMRAEQRQRK